MLLNLRLEKTFEKSQPRIRPPGPVSNVEHVAGIVHTTATFGEIEARELTYEACKCE
jgi:hypothetical protein